MYSDWVLLAASGFLAVWLGVLSFFVFKQHKFLKSLFPKSGERDIRKKFEEVVKEVEGFKSKLGDFDNKVEEVKISGLKHIQKVGLVRFNPYGDTGGDLSFAACFLDQEGTGIVITSLHARSGTRVFGKDIILGKSKKYELSKEELLAVKKALQVN